MVLQTSYDHIAEGDSSDITLSGTMAGSGSSDWIDLPYGPQYYSAHAVCTGAANWEMGNSDKTIVRQLSHNTYVLAPSGARVGYILPDAFPGAGASIRLTDTSGSSNVWTVWIKYFSGVYSP